MARGTPTDTDEADEGDLRARARLAKRGVKRSYTDPDAINKPIRAFGNAALAADTVMSGAGLVRGAAKMIGKRLAGDALGSAAGSAAKAASRTKSVRSGFDNWTVPAKARKVTSEPGGKMIAKLSQGAKVATKAKLVERGETEAQRLAKVRAAMEKRRKDVADAEDYLKGKARQRRAAKEATRATKAAAAKAAGKKVTTTAEGQRAAYRPHATSSPKVRTAATGKVIARKKAS